MATSHEWSYPGAKGTLAARTWSGDAPATHVVVVAHGYGEHVGRYERLAGVLVDGGAVVHAVDHQGHGRSEGERVVVEDFETVVDDLHALVEKARGDDPGLPVILLGHSMGGLIASRYAQRHADALAVLVLSSPVLGRWDAVTQLLALDDIPDVPLDVSTLSRDPEVGERYSADPLVWHGPFKRPTLEALQRAIDTVQSGPALGALPTLWVHGDDDQLVPLPASRTGIEHLRGDRFVEHIYPGARHELFNETNADEVIADVTSFVRGELNAR